MSQMKRGPHGYDPRCNCEVCIRTNTTLNDLAEISALKAALKQKDEDIKRLTAALVFARESFVQAAGMFAMSADEFEEYVLAKLDEALAGR